MKKLIVSASIVALLAGVLALTGDAWSQQGREAAEADANLPHKVGLIDMAYVFKNYKKFESMREDLKSEIGESELKAKEMQKEITELQMQMKDFKEGGADYTKTEKILVQKAADFENFRRQMSREFLKRESKIYLQVYNEVSSTVGRFAKFHKYTLIMRFNREDLDTENPQALLQGMNRQVVYYQSDDDITEAILTSLNNKFQKESQGGSPKPVQKTTEKPGANPKR